MLVQWQKDFEWGHPATDAEHRQVVDLLNELDVLLAAGSSGDDIDRGLDALARVLARHLRAEKAVAPIVSQVQILHRNWRESAAIPDRHDLRELAHWWLQHLCNPQHLH